MTDLRWDALPPPAAALRTVVVLPVRDEAPRLPAALDALAQQCHVNPDSYEVLLLANNCSDDSAAVARAAGACHPALTLHVTEVALEAPHANIGYVRRQLMDEACRRLDRAGPGGLIASTDGDTRVAPDWLAATRAEADAGAAAIGGRIVVDAAIDALPSARVLRLARIDLVHSLLRARLQTLLDPDAADPWPRHHQHFGASLAVTADGYRRAGGVPQVEFLEDDALVRAVMRADLPVRHSPQVRVWTSGRLDGRAEVGLSWQLRQWEDAADEARVEAPPCYADSLRARRRLRLLWQQPRAVIAPQLAAIAALLRVDEAALDAQLRPRRTFGAAWEDIERDHIAGVDRRGDVVPMSAAVAALRTLVRDAESDQPLLAA